LYGVYFLAVKNV
jgi:hypothetical protein